LGRRLERELKVKAVEDHPKVRLRQLAQLFVEKRQAVESRREIGWGGRRVRGLSGQSGCPLSKLFQGLLEPGDPIGNPPPERRRGVLGLEVRDLALDASFELLLRDDGGVAGSMPGARESRFGFPRHLREDRRAPR